jgi:predicted amidohydrolase
VSGAERSGAYVIKACGVGTLFGNALQGRSLIASPWGILAQTELSGESEKRLLTITVDISELREFRSKLPDRDLNRPAETSIN